MRNLIAHFKERPKTAVALLAVSLALGLTASWYVSEEYGPFDGYDGSGVATYVAGQPAPYAYDRMERGVADALVREARSTAFDDKNLGIAPPISPTAGETAADADQKIIRTSSMDLLVERAQTAALHVERIAKEAGGFVQSLSISERGNGVYYGNVVIRVPVERFEATLAALRGIATLVRNESSSGQDVTEQYTDLEAQLRNAEAQEETYLSVLKQARSVEDILKVQERLGAIRGHIESLEGRIQYLKNATSYSTISISLSEEATVRAPTKEFRPLAVIKAAFQALVIVFQDLIAGLLWVVIVWGGALLPIGVIVWFIRRWWKGRRKSRR